MVTIPAKSRPEWSQIVTGRLAYTFKNYVLQMRTHQMQKDIADKKINAQQAVDALYDLCSKYALAVQPDMKEIFKQW